MSRFWPHFIILWIALLVSAWTIGFDFVLFDDDYLVYGNQTIQDLGNFTRFFDPWTDRSEMGPEYLPITTTSFALDYALYGMSPAGFHLTNVVLYVLGCWMLYTLLARMLSHSGGALAGAILFACHPLHTESFAWVSERKSLLAFVFLLGSLHAYVSYRRHVDFRWYSYVVALLAFVLAFMSKYSVASLPLILLAYDFFIERRREVSRWSLVLSTVPFFAVAALMTWVAMDVATRYDIVRPVTGHGMQQLLNDPAIVLHYLKMLVVPIDQCAYYLWPLESEWTVTAIAGCATIVFLAWAAWALRHRAPVVGFAIVWFFALLLPVLNFVPKGVWMAERYVFLPSAALALVAAWVVMHADSRASATPRSRFLVASGVACIAGILAVACVFRSFVWKDSVTLWETTLQHPMGDPTAYDQLGLHYLAVERSPGKADVIFTTGLREMELRGTEASSLALRLRFHRLLCHLSRNAREEAREEWKQIARLQKQRIDPSVAQEYAKWHADLSRMAPHVLQ